MAKYVYFFGAGKAEGSSLMRNLLGGKGCELAEMTNLGIPVPPGFTITTQAWAHYYRSGRHWPEGLWEQILESVTRLEDVAGAALGDPNRPLLVSVRSGARTSMPGMMETVLNLGLNDQTVEGLVQRTGNERFALDCYRRFITMFGNVVLRIRREVFDAELGAVKSRLGVPTDPEVPAAEIRKLVETFKDIVGERTGAPFPQDPHEQLRLAINAVFDSWFANKAVEYRRIHGIPEEWGTAVTVMSMVFGNLGETSGTGVGFTRDPRTGEPRFYAEFLPNAQGEDVVAGIRTPMPIEALRDRMPAIYQELLAIAARLERHYKDMQDIEFTVQDGKLYLLQTRSGKRSAAAAVRVAVDFVREHVIDQHTALLRVRPQELSVRPWFDPASKDEAIAAGRLLARGLPAAPGAAVGQAVFDAPRAVEWAKAGQKVILVRPETSPEDVAGMYAAQGIVTSRGGRTSHAAVVAVGMGKACVVGASDIRVDEAARVFHAGGRIVREGDVISVDGGEGQVILDSVRTVEPELGEEFREFLAWADRYRKLGVRANADTPEDAARAREFGAEGIGLVRTEHMFFKPERIPIVRGMIMANDQASRRAALEKLRPFQRDDFIGIFRAMDGLPVTIRLLDPPLHEFLPNWKEYKEMVEEKSKLEALDMNPGRQRELDELIAAVERQREANPMLGHRGCRLGITFPEIYGMQVRAIMEAACQVTEEGGRVEVEIMIPLTGTVGEMKETFEQTKRVADGVTAEMGMQDRVKFLIGTMIEVPRAALIAQKIAEHAQFFSFGTNDLTQLTYGYSRDDVARFLPDYIQKGILPSDPFSVLDQEGVGELVEIGIDRGRAARPELKVGICGEHGGEPSSVEFCHRVKMNYVSCSPYLIPGARLAAAQARIKEQQGGGEYRA